MYLMNGLVFLAGFKLAPHHEPMHTSIPAPTECVTPADPKPGAER
jgi:hypothetical protein